MLHVNFLRLDTGGLVSTEKNKFFRLFQGLAHLFIILTDGEYGGLSLAILLERRVITIDTACITFFVSYFYQLDFERGILTAVVLVKSLAAIFQLLDDRASLLLVKADLVKVLLTTWFRCTEHDDYILIKVLMDQLKEANAGDPLLLMAQL